MVRNELHFQDLLPAERILTSSDARAHYGRDWLKQYSPNPSVILLPVTTAEVQAVVCRCKERSLALVPSGGRTGLSGGATALSGEIVLSLERMNKILEVRTLDRTLRCQAGTVTQKVQEAAEQHNLYFPVEFGSKGQSQIGGNIATNAGGIRVLRYGSMREWVVGLTAVTGRGDLIELNGALFKNQTGYDLRNLLIGSEGTLAVITEATLRLTALPFERTRILCALKSVEGVLSLFHESRSTFRELSAFEFFMENALEKVLRHGGLQRPLQQPHPCYALLEIERRPGESLDQIERFLAPKIEAGLILDAVVSQSQRQADSLLELRERISEVLSAHYMPHKNDISVPIPAISAFTHELFERLAAHYPGWELVVFGHIGDGNLHINILKPSEMSADEFMKRCHETDPHIFELVSAHRGSISAEHGVGLLKRDFLHFSRSPAEIALMREIKRSFDPHGIMNPGKIFAP